MAEYTLPRGTVVFHGTSQARLRALHGPMGWVALDPRYASWYASASAEGSRRKKRVVSFETTRPLKLVTHDLIPDIFDFAAQLEGKADRNDWDADLFAERTRRPGLSPVRYGAERTMQALCAHGYDGYIWKYRSESEIGLCNPSSALRFIASEVVP